MLNLSKDYLSRALDGEIILTKFLDEQEMKEFTNLKNIPVKIVFEGGHEASERKRAIICHVDEKIVFEDFKINIYEINFANGGSFNHRQLLGTLMSLGINRNSFGDILITNNHTYVFVSSEIAKYIEQNFTEVCHVPLELKKIANLNEVETIKTVEKNVIVPSFRLDAIIAHTINKSRGDVEEIINKGLVMVNHKECINTSYTVKINDVISIRHFGRIEFLEVIKTTKKDRQVIKVGVKH